VVHWLFISFRFHSLSLAEFMDFIGCLFLSIFIRCLPLISWISLSRFSTFDSCFLPFVRFDSITEGTGEVGSNMGTIWEPYRVEKKGVGKLSGRGGRCRVRSCESRDDRPGNGLAHNLYIPRSMT
jgi:hypothetical protein